MSCPNAAEARNSRRVILLVCMRVFLQQRQRLVAENTVSSALRFPQSQVCGNFGCSFRNPVFSELQKTICPRCRLYSHVARSVVGERFGDFATNESMQLRVSAPLEVADYPRRPFLLQVDPLRYLRSSSALHPVDHHHFPHAHKNGQMLVKVINEHDVAV